VSAIVAERISAAGRRGSSRPVVVETSAGARLVKLRGAAQGTGPLVAEIVVAELAEAIGLSVPPRSLITLPAGIKTADWDDELDDLLAASVGVNLGFDFLPGARELAAGDVERVAPADQAAILWLDRLVMNPDRTARNPNLLWWSGHLWLIDHGASLGFQYTWERVTESSPREPRLMPDAHLFDAAVPQDDLRAADETLAKHLTRDVLEAAVAAVPESFLRPLLGIAEDAEPGSRSARRRAAYVAFLWKRLKAPRPFLEAR
jgi:HipA-like protein